MSKELMQAIKNGEVDKIRNLVSNDPKLIRLIYEEYECAEGEFEESYPSYYTPIHLAIKHDKLEIVKLLCELNPYITLAYSSKHTGLVYPLELATELNRFEIVKFLVEVNNYALEKEVLTKGAINNAANAGYNNIVDYLLAEDASLYNINIFLNAIRYADLERLNLFLQTLPGLDLANLTDQSYNIHKTYYSNTTEGNILQYAIEHAAEAKKYQEDKEFNLSDLYSTSIREYDPEQEHQKAKLADKVRSDDKIKIIEALLAFKPDLIEGGNKYSALHTACEKSTLAIIEILLKHKPELISKLNDNGDSALHYAIKNKYYSYEIIKSLIDKNPDLINIVNEQNETVLHTLVKKFNLNNNKQEIIDLICKKEPELVYQVNKENKTATQIAAESGYQQTITELLIRYEVQGGKFDAEQKLILSGYGTYNNSNYSSDDEQSEEENEYIPCLRTALHFAAANKRDELVKYLLPKFKYEYFSDAPEGNWRKYDYADPSVSLLVAIVRRCQVDTIKVFLEHGGGGEMNFTYIDSLFSQLEEQKHDSNKFNEEFLRLKAMINYQVLSPDDLESLKHRYESITLAKISKQKANIVELQTSVTKIVTKINLLKEEFVNSFKKDSPILSLTFLAAHKVVAKQIAATGAPDHVKEIVKSMQSFCTGKIFQNQYFLKNEVKKLLVGLEEDLMPLSLSLKEQSEEDLPYFTIDFDAYADKQMKEILADENYAYVRPQPNIAELYPLLQEIEKPMEYLSIGQNLSIRQSVIFEDEQCTFYAATTIAPRPSEYITIEIGSNNNNLFDF